MATNISDRAVVDPQAEVHPDAAVGPFCIVGPHARIGRGTRLLSHVTISGRVTLGEENIVYPNVVIGAEPQDYSYNDEPTDVRIGNHNVFREGVTVNRATTKERSVTSIGDHNYFMACCHVAHDCVVGNHVLMANCVLLGGHTHVHDRAILSGNAAVHHWTTIGSYSFVGGLTKLVHDVPPFMLVDGNPASVRCVNLVGLRRQGFTREETAALGEAHRLIYRARMSVPHAREMLVSQNHMTTHVEALLDFLARQRDGLHGRQRQPQKPTLDKAA